ncbi:MAG: DUF924 family protein [Pseudomonadota bacterium]|nr:DUF924 family protein [Pseudomonadota bacterium]
MQDSITTQPITPPSAQAVLEFWFQQHGAQDWFGKDPAFDHAIRTQFLATYQQAITGELMDWRSTAQGRLAEIIVLDQFARNLFRGQPQQFAGDSVALVLAQEAIAQGADQLLTPEYRVFMYMPYMHSESRWIHQQALQLFTALGIAHNLDFEIKHKVIIDRFGRYPHRNAILGRESSAEELDFLQQPNSRF